MIERLRRPLAIYAFYLLIAALITWPLVVQLGTHLAGFDYADSREMAHHIWWYKHALQTGQSPFWQPDLGYPDGMESMLLWADPLQFFPAWLIAFMLPTVAAANLTILLTMTLNGWAMYCLARHMLRGNHAAALLAGVVFMAAPTFQAHLAGGHAGLLVMWPVPLLIYALLRLRETEARGWFVLAVIFFGFSPGGHGIQSIYVLLPLMAVILLMRLWQRDWLGLRQTLVVSILGGLLLLVFLLPLALAASTTPAYRDEGGFVRYSADLLSVASPSFFHPLYQHLGYPARVLGVNLEEGSSYIGIVAGLLALLGLWRGGRSTRWWLLLALIAWVASLGPLLKIFDQPLLVRSDGYESALTLPWAFVQNLPFFNLARTPGRFNFTLALAVALLAGYGADVLWRWLRPGRWRLLILGGLIAAVLFDYQWYWPLPTHDASIPNKFYDIAQFDDVWAILNLPWEHSLASKEALYLRTAHQKPILAGHITRGTPVSPAKLNLLQATLDPALLRSVGADLVVWHKKYAHESALSMTEQQLGPPIFEDADYAVYETPPTEAAPEFAALLSNQAALESSAETYFYAPEAGWVDLQAELIADGRTVNVYLDDRLNQSWFVDGRLNVTLPVSLLAGEFHRLTLALEPPCPTETGPTLICRAVTIEDLRLSLFRPAALELVQLGQGVRLRGSEVRLDENQVQVRLWWFFAEALQETDIRFVHVVDAEGQPVVQEDSPLGALAAESGRVEQVNLTLPDDLPDGTYAIYAGWYSFPDITRFEVQSDVPGANDDLIYLGSVDLPE